MLRKTFNFHYHNRLIRRIITKHNVLRSLVRNHALFIIAARTVEACNARYGLLTKAPKPSKLLVRKRRATNFNYRTHITLYTTPNILQSDTVIWSPFYVANPYYNSGYGESNMYRLFLHQYVSRNFQFPGGQLV